jgi:hypothetical protein
MEEGRRGESVLFPVSNTKSVELKPGLIVDSFKASFNIQFTVVSVLARLTPGKLSDTLSRFVKLIMKVTAVITCHNGI